MRYLIGTSVIGLLVAGTGCGPSKSEQAKTEALAEIKKSNAEQGEAIRARCAKLGAAAALLQDPQVTAAVPANTNFEIYPEFYSTWQGASPAKAEKLGETVPVAVVCWNHLDTYNSEGVKNEPADDLTFLCRPLGFYYDVKKVKDALADPSVFDGVENYRRLRELLLGTRYVLALEQLDYRDAELEEGTDFLVFNPGHVAFRAVLIDVEQPAVLAIGEGEATNSDEIETHFSFKRDDATDEDRASRKSGEEGLRDDLRKHAYAALEQTLQSMVSGAGQPAEQELGPDGKLHDAGPVDTKLSEPIPSDDSKLSDPSPDTKIP
ncbi:MAG: hypothetical protein K2Y37_07655 [Pirellulales bacterium]|nr:hypothetical protein [Pirellulales bacterium]